MSRSRLALAIAASIVPLLLNAHRSSAAPPAAAEVEIAGAVRDLAGEPIAGAAIAIGGRTVATSDEAGRFSFRVPAGPLRLMASAAGYRTLERPLEARADLADLELTLEPGLWLTEGLVVRALRASEQTPATASELAPERMQALVYGQEMPFVLATTPAIASYSESGLALGAGYSYFSLRGISQSRINMTFDGVPLNDPGESAVYFANFGDFASVIGSVQVQRGVGTSTVGSAAYGGSIQFESVPLADRRLATLELAGGSYGTRRASLRVESGRLPLGLALYARYSDLTSDGYRERSGLAQQTLFAGGDWRGERSYLRFFGFSGREQTELAFYAVEPWILAENPRFNPMQPGEDDAFGQDLAYVQFGRLLAGGGEVAAQLYYHGAQGYLFLFDDPAARSGRRKIGIDGETLGTLVTGSFAGEGWQLSTGLHASTFARDHWAFLAGVRQYENTGEKWETSAFAKLGYDLGERWHLFGDLQLRHAEFRYDGAIDLGPVSWSFVNPKLGVRYRLSDRASLYLALGRAEREPARGDLLEGEDDLAQPIDLRAVRPERVTNLELGSDYRGERLSATVNLYAMEFRDEIAATGEQSELGYAIRRNLPESSRRGVELEAAWRPDPRLTVRAAAALGRFRIERWRQALDLYDPEGNAVGQELTEFRDTPPALSPEEVFFLGLEWQPLPELAVELSGRHVGRSYLDNTGDRRLSADPYGWADLALRLDLARWWRFGAPRLRLQVNNLLDAREVWPSGYSYPYLVRDERGATAREGVPYYYPQARRHFVAGLELRF